MRVIGYDPYMHPDKAMECGRSSQGIIWKPSLHRHNPCLTDETRGMVGSEAVKRIMKEYTSSTPLGGR